MFSEGNQSFGDSTWGVEELPFNVSIEATSSSSPFYHLNYHLLLGFTEHALCMTWVQVIEVFY